MNKNLNNIHDNKDMDTQCIYIDHIFSLIGNEKKYHIFAKGKKISYCGLPRPKTEEKYKEMVRLGSICPNCHRELIKDL